MANKDNNLAKTTAAMTQIIAFTRKAPGMEGRILGTVLILTERLLTVKFRRIITQDAWVSTVCYWSFACISYITINILTNVEYIFQQESLVLRNTARNEGVMQTMPDIRLLFKILHFQHCCLSFHCFLVICRQNLTFLTWISLIKQYILLIKFDLNWWSFLFSDNLYE